MPIQPDSSQANEARPPLESTRVGDPLEIGDYQVLHKIGAGGMGSVYLGKHKKTGQIAAVKVLPGSLARETGFVERFNREIESMQRLQHPNIVRFFDSGVDNETYYYTMEYVPGETVMHLLRRERRVPWQQAVDYAIQVCHALKAAHDAGIIHRDLKPSNLLLTPEGVIKLTDFGVAQVFAADRLTITGGIIGTAEFMSPEQAQGKRATKQSDLYSLGAVLYCLITGRPPFSGNTAVDVIQKHRFGKFDRPRMYVPELPSWLDDIIVQLLEKEPEKRFPDAYVLARRLESVVKKSEYVQLGETRISSPGDEEGGGLHSAATRVESGNAGGAGIGPSTLMRELVKLHFRRESESHWIFDLLNNSLVLLLLLVLTIGGGIWWFIPRQIPSEQLFEAGVAALDQEPGPGWTAAREQYFAPLQALNDPEWATRIQPYLQQIEVYESTRGSGLKSLKRKSSQSEPVQLISRAMALQNAGDLHGATRILDQLSTLLKNDPEHAELAKLVNRLLLRCLEEQEGTAAKRAAWVGSLLHHAEQRHAEQQHEAARQILTALLQLYGEDHLVKDELAKARALLDKLPAAKASGEPQSPEKDVP